MKEKTVFRHSVSHTHLNQCPTFRLERRRDVSWRVLTSPGLSVTAHALALDTFRSWTLFSCRSHGHHFCLIFFKDSFGLLSPGYGLSLILCCSLFWAALYFASVWVLRSYSQMCCNLNGLGAINAWYSSILFWHFFLGFDPSCRLYVSTTPLHRCSQTGVLKEPAWPLPS